MLRGPRVPAIMAFAFLATWASIWQVAYLPYYYSEALGASVPVAGLMAAGVLVSGLFGKALLGALSDRVRRDRLLAILSLAVVAAYGVFFSTADFYVGLGCALLMGFFSSSIFPGRADQGGNRRFQPFLFPGLPAKKPTMVSTAACTGAESPSFTSRDSGWTPTT